MSNQGSRCGKTQNLSRNDAGTIFQISLDTRELTPPPNEISGCAYRLQEELERLFSTGIEEGRIELDFKAWEGLLRSTTTDQINDVIESRVEKQRLVREKAARERGEQKPVKATRPQLPPPQVILDCLRDLSKSQPRKRGYPKKMKSQLEFMAKSLADWGKTSPRRSRDKVDKLRAKFKQAARSTRETAAIDKLWPYIR